MVKTDIEFCNIKLNYEENMKTKKSKFKAIVKKVYESHNLFPLKGSWASMAKTDLEFCNIKLTDEEIMKTKKSKFKAIVKKAIRIKSNNYLLELQSKHSKSKHLEILDEPTEYLISEELTLVEKRLLFKLRSRMIDIKENFKFKYSENLLCSLCETTEETAAHLLKYPKLINDPKVG